MKRVTRMLALLAVALIEPVFHLLNIPHPEGLSAQAANLLITHLEA